MYQCNLGNVAAFSFSKNCNMAGRTTYGNHYIFYLFFSLFSDFFVMAPYFLELLFFFPLFFIFRRHCYLLKDFIFFQKVFIFMDYGNKTLNEAYSCNTHPKLSDILSIQFGWRLLRIISNLLSCPSFNV